MIYKRHTYPDGWSYGEILDFNEPVIRERINNTDDLFFIKSLKEICDYNRIKEVTLEIPWLPQQQHDRRFETNQSFELKIISDFINSCNFHNVRIFHPHSDVSPALINNCEVITNADFVNDVLSKLDKKPTLLSTDGGSYKWIHKVANIISFDGEVYGASKSRDILTHKLTQVIDKQNFNGDDVLVLDDLSVYGGTFLGLASMLRERNVGKLYLAVSHITVKNPNKSLEVMYDKIFTTNSKYDEYDLSNLEIFNVNKYF